MSLKLYQKKRNFKITSKSKGHNESSATHHLYVIQKHVASHLHYDFHWELKMSCSVGLS